MNIEQNDWPRNKTTKAKWQNLLFVKQDYPDNFVDDTFLKDMSKNGIL